MPRDEAFQGEGHDGELEKRSEFVNDLPEPDADAPSGDGGDGGDSGGGDDSSTDSN